MAIYPHLGAHFVRIEIKKKIASHKYSSKQIPLLQRVAVAALLSKTFV